MKHIKLGTLSTITFLMMFTLSSTANTRDGFYVGAGIGRSFDQYLLAASNVANRYTINADADDGNTLGNIFIGIGYTTETAFFLGGEVGANFPSRKVNITGLPGVSVAYPIINNTLAVQDYVTMDLLPGYAINPTILVYGRAGLAYGELSLKQPRIGNSFGFNISENKWGGRLGLGANYALNNNFGIGIDYYYSIYQEMNIYSPVFNTHFTPKARSNFLGLSVLYTV